MTGTSSILIHAAGTGNVSVADRARGEGRRAFRGRRLAPWHAAITALLPAMAPATDSPTATLKVHVDRDFVNVELRLPSRVVPASLHGAPTSSGPAPEPPYALLLVQGDGMVSFPVESRCHSDGESQVRVRLPGAGEQAGPVVAPPVPPEDSVIESSYLFHCDALPRVGLEWIGLEVFDQLPALEVVLASEVSRQPPLEQHLTSAQRRLRLRPEVAAEPAGTSR